MTDPPLLPPPFWRTVYYEEDASRRPDRVTINPEDDIPLADEIERASQHPEHIEAALELLRSISWEQRQQAA